MAAAIEVRGLVKRFDQVIALAGIDATINAAELTGLVGPDGAGKTTLLRVLAGLMAPTEGSVQVAGHDVVTDNAAIHGVVGYMPQRFGLYEDLTVIENLDLYARLRGLARDEASQVFGQLLHFTRLEPFTQRLAGRLSGGMKQKLGLACALMARPEVLLLDEPSVGVDPVSRQELWHMVQALIDDGMAVVWSTAYLDEAERCDTVLLLHDAKLEYHGAPSTLTSRIEGRSYRIVSAAASRRRLLADALELDGVSDAVVQGDAVRAVLKAEAATGPLAALAQRHAGQLDSVAPRFEDAFIDLLGGGPGGRSAIAERMPVVTLHTDVAVRCQQLTKRFAACVATDAVSFDVMPGEVFGLLGPNGAGKSTTFKMLCGLLKPSAGEASVVGFDLRRAPSKAKLQLGYMAQKFSLYGLLSVAQNLDFYAGIYSLVSDVKRQRIDEMIETFGLERYLDASPETLPLGFKQRLALACALMHRPAVLFLDEPTSGVDPITRREFWMHINGLVRKGVTVLVTTHFMDEAEYCDRVALMYRAQVIALDSPDALKASVADSQLPDPTMQDAFIRLVQRADTGAEGANAAERAA
jgi:drug efflux transport system ATP-binding protein